MTLLRAARMAFTAGRGGTTPRYSASMSEYSKSPKASRLPRKDTGSESSTQVRSRSNFSSKRSEAAGNLCSGQKKLERGRGNPRKRYFRYPDARQIKIVEDGHFPAEGGMDRDGHAPAHRRQDSNVTVSEIGGDGHVSIQVELGVGEIPVNRRRSRFIVPRFALWPAAIARSTQRTTSGSSLLSRSASCPQRNRLPFHCIW